MKMYPFPSKINTKIKILGIYQILGGAYGTYFNLAFLNTHSQLPDLIILLFSIAIFLYCYSIVCGIFIFTKKDIQLKYTLINQYLQLISFSILGYAFQYASGIYLYIGVIFTDNINFKATAGITTWQIMFNTDSNVMEVYLNIVPVFIIIFIDRIKRQISEFSVGHNIEGIPKETG